MPLATGQLLAAFPDDRVVALREFENELVSLGRPCGQLDLRERSADKLRNLRDEERDEISMLL